MGCWGFLRGTKDCGGLLKVVGVSQELWVTVAVCWGIFRDVEGLSFLRVVVSCLGLEGS